MFTKTFYAVTVRFFPQFDMHVKVILKKMAVKREKSCFKVTDNHHSATPSVSAGRGHQGATLRYRSRPEDEEISSWTGQWAGSFETLISD